MAAFTGCDLPPFWGLMPCTPGNLGLSTFLRLYDWYGEKTDVKSMVNGLSYIMT